MMASDIQIKYVSNLENVLPEADFELDNGDLIREEGLGTAVIISLFTDRRADDSDPYENNDKRGWWGDLTSDIEGDQTGSKLYLLKRADSSQKNVILTKQYSYEALEWMIEDGVASSVDVDAWSFGRPESKRLGFKVDINKTDGTSESFQFDDLWEYTSTIGVK